MIRHRFSPLFALCALTLTVPAFSADLERATITEAFNSVTVIDRATKAKSQAKVNGEFLAPNIMRTGSNSRAELVAPDNTVTRIGSDTLFSFIQNSRELDLEKGSLLFHAPSGKGGGTVRTPAASAAVLGTTIIVSTTRKGGVKVLMIEGKGRVTPKNGKKIIIRAGEMVIIEPGDTEGKVSNFRIREQSENANLIKKFKRPLPSKSRIDQAINKQEKEITNGDSELMGRDLGTDLLIPPPSGFQQQPPQPKPPTPKPEPRAQPKASPTPNPKASPRPFFAPPGGTTGSTTGGADSGSTGSTSGTSGNPTTTGSTTGTPTGIPTGTPTGVPTGIPTGVPTGIPTGTSTGL